MPHHHALPFNQLLAALPGGQYLHMAQDMQPITLEFGTLLYDAGQTIAYVYFPDNALVSMLALIPGHQGLEVAMVGREGMVGTSLALGQPYSEVRTIVQCSGTCLRMEANRFLAYFEEGQALQHEVLLHAQSLTLQMAETAACNHFHSITQRLARWLLMARDRVGANQFHLTQEFLGNMLGVRRAGVTDAAHRLKTLGLIDYSRGDIEIQNTQGLLAAACHCYRNPFKPAQKTNAGLGEFPLG